MLPTTDHRIRARAALCIAAALVLVGGQFGTLAHNAFVQHRVCAEHNELEHAAPNSEAHTAAGLTAPGLTGDHDGHSAALDTSGGDRNGDGHDHCELASAVRQPLARAVASVHTGHAAPVQLTAALTPRTVANHRASYRLAPKQSPPA